jgi:hypothetical protein
MDSHSTQEMNETINNSNTNDTHDTNYTNNNNEIHVTNIKLNTPAKEECVELRNMKYKSMLLKKTNTKQLTKCNSNIDIDSFLEKERTQNKEDQWTKLDKSMKNSKILAFVDNYANENNLNEKDKSFLQNFLFYCLEQKKLTKTKDVVYDKVTGTITSIPCLLYTPTLTKKFTLKRCEKRPSTLSSLAPKSKVSRRSMPSKSNTTITNTMTMTTSGEKNNVCEGNGN